MPGPLLPKAPIDEVVFGFILSTPLGPDAVDAGRYFADRRDRFTKHEIKEPILSEPGWVESPGPVRVWLSSEDESWLVQLQQDRFHANWRRRGEAVYPGFTRAGGAMHFALDEFRRFQDFCERLRGERPTVAAIDVSKIDVLVQARHWDDLADALHLVPSLRAISEITTAPTPVMSLGYQESLNGMTVSVSIMPAKTKAPPSVSAFRLEFRAAQPAGDDLEAQFVAMNVVLNEAFVRAVPNHETRFS